MVSKKLLAQFKMKAQNNKRLKNILNIVVCKIVAQKEGCFIPGLGVSFINYNNQTRDPIGHLLGYSDLKGFWGLISSEAQSCLVNKIRNKYNFDISYPSEGDRLVNFLQSLQDAHDLAFDEFNNLIVDKFDRLTNFLADCNKIKKQYQL